MLYLMNSAMMPQDGCYRRKTINTDTLAGIFLGNTNDGLEWKSYIGYPNAANILSDLLGIEIPVSRNQVTLENGDVILVMKLKYRVNPEEKAGEKHGGKIGDYEFCRIDYLD